MFKYLIAAALVASFAVAPPADAQHHRRAVASSSDEGKLCGPVTPAGYYVIHNHVCTFVPR